MFLPFLLKKEIKGVIVMKKLSEYLAVIIWIVFGVLFIGAIAIQFYKDFLNG